MVTISDCFIHTRLYLFNSGTVIFTFFRIECDQRSSCSSDYTSRYILSASSNALYILGGGAQSTKHHIKKAAVLYTTSQTDTILIRYSILLWDFDPKLGGNPTLNEVETGYQNGGGVPTQCIETVKIQEGFFYGTLSEARDVAAIAKEILHINNSRDISRPYSKGWGMAWILPEKKWHFNVHCSLR